MAARWGLMVQKFSNLGLIFLNTKSLSFGRIAIHHQNLWNISANLNNQLFYGCELYYRRLFITHMTIFNLNHIYTSFCLKTSKQNWKIGHIESRREAKENREWFSSDHHKSFSGSKMNSCRVKKNLLDPQSLFISPLVSYHYECKAQHAY